ncbi:hypothetical protein [Actinoplanes couchii]|uniref:Uncharacterized protein n=1 Tax=Actinoplanes couchii TaxID=403638 RepID=A0ABQ3XDF4_9ACTN|nr:hypothetical protein [Actinoplanes couchii]MDR6317049.1 hypothetical protein [Actinoplanes couchii]GID56545.1 hypothetical protein Aco03nite_049490 [Actinoplanes couchii]
MTRKPPGQVRADLAHRRDPGVRTALVEGVSARGLSRIAQLERADLRPGAAAAAWRRWQAFARASAEERADMLYYGHAGCCPDPRDDRDVLERVLRVLPLRDARALRRRIETIDSACGM